MKKIGLIGGAIVLTVLAWMAAMPLLVDVEQYKPAMADAVKRATGRELVIDGKMRLSMFPTPRITARNVRFANAVGAKGAQMVDVKWVSVSPSWSALLGGQIEIGKLTLVRPTIVLETDAEGRPNWEFDPGAAERQQPGEASSGFHLTIGRLAIEEGRLTYTDPKTGTSIVAEKIAATAAVGSLDGPFEFVGTTVVNGLPLTIDFKMSAPTAVGHALKLALQLDIGKLDFTGSLSELGPRANLAGQLSVNTGSMTDFVTKLVRATGQPAPTIRPALVGRFTFDGGVEVAPDRVAITNFKMGLGGETATGSLALSEKPTLSLEGKVSLPKLNADKWRETLAQPNGLLPEATKAKIVAAPTLSPFPPEMDVKLALDVADVTLEKASIRDVSLAVEIRKGVIALSRLAAKLPGDMAFSADAASGAISLAGAKPRETLAWLGIDASDVPAERLKNFQLKGKFAAAAGKLQVTEALLEFDDQRGKGGATVTLGPPTALALQLEFDRLDLDAYLPPPSKDFALARVAPPAAMGVPPKEPATLPVNLKAKVGKLLYRGEVFSGVSTDATLQGKVLRLADLRVADAIGARAVVRGSLSDLDATPKYDLTVDIAATDADRVMGFLGVPVLRKGALGAASLSGNVAGTGLTATLRNVTANFLGSTAQATGSLSFEGNGRFDFSSFSFKTAEVSRLVAAASGRPTSGIGAASVSGKLAGSMERATFTGDADINGSRMSGTIASTLGTRPMVTADLRVPGTLDLDKWLGVSAAPAVPANAGGAVVTVAPKPGAVTATPINTSALNGFDAKVTLKTSAMMIASLRLDYADADVTLKNGALTVSKLTGQFYGGGIDVSGTVKTSGAGLALDFKGAVVGIYLGQMLRGTADRNVFGTDLAITLDGKINATNMQLSGAGNTPEAIRNSLKGTATLGGYLYPSVDPKSRSSALFFGGIASVFSDDLAMGVLVLKRFVNRENPISGQVTLAGGHVTGDNLLLTGDKAAARITSRTNVATAVTQTTIVFNTDNSGSQLVTKVTGALSAPILDTDRVAARR